MTAVLEWRKHSYVGRMTNMSLDFNERYIIRSQLIEMFNDFFSFHEKL